MDRVNLPLLPSGCGGIYIYIQLAFPLPISPSIILPLLYRYYHHHYQLLFNLHKLDYINHNVWHQGW